MPIAEDDGLERVVVLRSDLEMWADALWRAHGYSYATDAVEGYRGLRFDVKPSKLTNVLARAYNRAEAYLPGETDDSGMEPQ